MSYVGGVVDRYVFWGYWRLLGAYVACFCLVIECSNTLGLAGDAITRGVAASAAGPGIARFAALGLPYSLQASLPFASLFAVEVLAASMARSNELTVVRASGRSVARAVCPALVACVVAAAACFSLGEWVVPTTSGLADTAADRLRFARGLAVLRQRVFFRDRLGRVYFLDRVDASSGRAGGVVVYEPRSADRPARITTAESAVFGSGGVEFANGAVHELDPSGRIVLELSFGSMTVRPECPVDQLLEGQRSAVQMNTSELRAFIRVLEAGGLDAATFRMELALRFAVPLAVILLPWAGLAPAARLARAKRASGIVAGAVLSAAYFLSLGAVRYAVSNGLVPATLAVAGAWAPDAVLLGIGAVGVALADRP